MAKWTVEIFVQPHPVIRRMTFSETMDELDNVRKSSTMSSEFFVEAVAYQQAAIEEMERGAFSVEAMHPIKDKRARLRVAARYIKMGVVKFPRVGCEQLLTQSLGCSTKKTTTMHSWEDCLREFELSDMFEKTNTVLDIVVMQFTSLLDDEYARFNYIPSRLAGEHITYHVLGNIYENPELLRE